MNIQFFFDNAWRWISGLPEIDIKPKQKPSYEQLKESEWSPEFEKHMRTRLIMGAIRYGLIHEKGKPKYNRIESSIKRLQLYQETGNLEFLVDVANLCLLEYEEGDHPTKHLNSLPSCEHVEEL